MRSICLSFKVHQPFQLKHYSSQDINVIHCYEDAKADEDMINRISDCCYIPANDLMLHLIKQYEGKFKISYSISGIVLDLFRKYRPDVIDSFRQLTKTGCVEILAETYYHSLSWLYSKKEFERQLKKHKELIKTLFGLETKVFRNTDLIHSNRRAKLIASLGYKGLLCEGVDRLLHGRNMNRVYAAPDVPNFGLLLRNASLSNDIAFRFGEEHWNEYPLTAEKFAGWIHEHSEESEVINLFMDYETFGMHKPESSGIFSFLEHLPAFILKNENFGFSLPTEVLANIAPKDIYDVQETISWDDKGKECCVWCENMMQNNTLKKIYSLEKIVLASKDERVTDVWGRLQTADYFYYMADKYTAGNYVNPFESAKEVFEYFTNITTDFEISMINKELDKRKKQIFSSIKAMLF